MVTKKGITKYLAENGTGMWHGLPIFKTDGNIDLKLEAIEIAADVIGELADKRKAKREKARKWLADVYKRPAQVVLKPGADAASILKAAMDEETSGNAVWRDCYGGVVEWLKDNKHKGIVLSGAPGTGKTMTAEAICSILEHETAYPIYNIQAKATELAQDMKNDESFAKGKISHHTFVRALFIDDLGMEGEAYVNGAKTLAFNEFINGAMENGTLLILTTNLRKSDLRAKYGLRTFDRLRQLTTFVEFDGESMRNTWQAAAELKPAAKRPYLPDYYDAERLAGMAMGKYAQQREDEAAAEQAEHARNFGKLLAWAAENTPNVAQALRPLHYSYYADKRCEKQKMWFSILEGLQFNGGDVYAEISRIWGVFMERDEWTKKFKEAPF